MSFTAVVEKGVIALPNGVDLPDGTRVLVNPAIEEGASLDMEEIVAKPGSFLERYADFAGIADDLPSDLAAQVDHYVHGQPKRP